jgi:hypothetical protein
VAQREPRLLLLLDVDGDVLAEGVVGALLNHNVGEVVAQVALLLFEVVDAPEEVFKERLVPVDA